MDQGEFFVSMEIFERALNFKWEVIIVYGPADHRCSPTFLAELQQKISCSSLPVVVGGDFNLIRSPDEKNNDRVNRPRMQMFTDYIAELGLCELERTGARFTWTNRQANPTQSVLDRVLVSPEWELRCPLASLQAITRIGSDHVLLLLSSADERPPSLLGSGLSSSGSTRPDSARPLRLSGPPLARLLTEPCPRWTLGSFAPSSPANL